MDRRRGGMEGNFGILGGIVTKEEQKNLDIAEDLCRRGKPEESLPYLFSAMENPDNLDAFIQFAFLNQKKDAIKILEKTELRGRGTVKRILGNDAFEDTGDCVGRFWALLETRPYMRVQQALVRLYLEEGQYKKCAQTIIEMLRLCPGDNLGQRSTLGSVLLRLNRNSDALSFAQAWLMERDDVLPRGGTRFSPPSRNLLPKKEVEQLEKWGKGALVHTAALASFRLYGNCQQSREYLRIAVKAHPHVLLKVLARVARPSDWNMEARIHNGAEDAQDYLFITQDLWMAPDVWKWADENPDVKEALLVKCSKAECNEREQKVAEFKRCAACHLVRYCGPACQKEDWPKHKPKCKQHQSMKAYNWSVLRGKPTPKDMSQNTYSMDSFTVRT